jgi:ABC-type branched-subunit amino acid transport system substrate-binding protein
MRGRAPLAEADAVVAQRANSSEYANITACKRPRSAVYALAHLHKADKTLFCGARNASVNWLKALMAICIPALALAQPDGAAPIVIGVSNVQSGPSQSIGQELMRGSMAYFDAVNGTGGIHGRRIAIILKDDRYEPEPAIRNTQDLITKDKVFFLFDYVGTPTLTRVLPLLRYYQDDRIVNVAPFTGADPQRVAPYSQYVFSIRASYREEAHELVNYLYAKGIRRFGFLGQADAYGKSGQVGVEEALQQHGLHIIASVAYRRNYAASEGMREQLEYLQSKQVDAVIAVGVYGPCSDFIREARLAHWKIPIANVSFVNAEAMLSILRTESDKAHVDLTANLINSQVVPFPRNAELPLVRAYLARLGEQSSGFTSLEGWINAAVVTEALKRAGPDPSRAAFIQALESLHGWDPGIGYPLQFSATDHQGMHEVWLTKTANASWVPEAFPIGPP